MIKVCCNICGKHIQNYRQGPEFCEPHLEHAEEFIAEVNKIMAQGFERTNKQIETFRGQFLQRISKRYPEAVGS